MFSKEVVALLSILPPTETNSLRNQNELMEENLVMKTQKARQRAETQLDHQPHSSFCYLDDINRMMNHIDINEVRREKGSGKRNLLGRVSLSLPQTLKKCNPDYCYEVKTNPRRVLTKPSEGTSNHGNDNNKNDLIIYVNDIFEPDPPNTGPKYSVVDLLGQGTFGQVVKCINLHTNEAVAIKVVKNKPAYKKQGQVELNIVLKLNQQFDAENKGHIVRLKDYFQHKNHLCLVFELLSINLYELIKLNKHRGFSMNLLRIFLQQIIEAQQVLTRAHCIHCDLKPENILLCDLSSPQIKVIDYGSACYEHQTVFSYIQSRFYRSPEVILGISYTAAIDMWSIGCIAAELFFGLPLFPGNSEFNQITLITSMLGQPPDWMLQQGKNTRKYFNPVPLHSSSSTPHFYPTNYTSHFPNTMGYSIKPENQYARETRTRQTSTRRYFTHPTLTDNIMNFAMKKNLSEEQIEKEKAQRQCFAHFLCGLLQLDPKQRWTPEQAIEHPFITESVFSPSWAPKKAVMTTKPIPIGKSAHAPSPSIPSSFSPASSPYFKNFNLGTSPSTTFGSIPSSPVYSSGSPLSKDISGGYNNAYPSFGYSPNHAGTTPPMYGMMSNLNSYNPYSFLSGSIGTPTKGTGFGGSSWNGQPDFSSPSSSSFGSPTSQAAASSMQKNYRTSQPRYQTQQGFVTATKSNTSGPIVKKKTHKKMRSAGQSSLQASMDVAYSPSSPPYSPHDSISPLSSPSDNDWEDPFFMEEGGDSSPPGSSPPQQTLDTSSSYNYPISDPQKMSSAYNENQNAFHSFSQGALSYNEKSYLHSLPFRLPPNHSTKKNGS